MAGWEGVWVGGCVGVLVGWWVRVLLLVVVCVRGDRFCVNNSPCFFFRNKYIYIYIHIYLPTSIYKYLYI